MSPRKMARILGITPAYLSMLLDGKRRWRPDLYVRYSNLVTTVDQERQPNPAYAGDRVEGTQPITTVAGARGSRTHCPGRRAEAIGFEVLKCLS